MKYLKEFEKEVAGWPDVSVHPHQFGGREFRFGRAEIGHVHNTGVVDIPFPRAIRDALLEEGLAEVHHWLPNSGWITFLVHNKQDLQHAAWLMRLSYLRYALKRADDSKALFEQQVESLHLTPRFQTLLQKFIPS